MTSSIRGHAALFKVFENGQEHVFDTITSISISQDSNMSKSFYVGNPLPEGDQTIEGWSGSFDMEVKDDRHEEFMDSLITNNQNGVGVSDYTFIVTEKYPNGTKADYVYFDCQFKLDRSYSGLNEKVTKSMSFQSMGRVRL